MLQPGGRRAVRSPGARAPRAPWDARPGEAVPCAQHAPASLSDGRARHPGEDPLGGAPYGTILPDEHPLARRDSRDVGALRRDDRIEWFHRRRGEHVSSTLACAVAVRRVGLDDDDIEPGKPEQRGMNAREAELEHPRRRLSELLEDPWRRACRERRRQAAHSSRSTAIAQRPRTSAPRVNDAVTNVDPWRREAACQIPTRPRRATRRTYRMMGC